jgi:hypothetical protein
MRGGFLDVTQRHSSVETGRERITNRVEYLSSQDGAMRLLPSSLPL